MDTIPLPRDFSEFLKLLSIHGVRYLLVGGYAVAYHGYVRATADLDIWIDSTDQNAERVVKALTVFGFGIEKVTPDLFLTADRVVRMGHPPFRIEILTSVSGLSFNEAYDDRIEVTHGDLVVNILSLPDLKTNKRAAGRHQDLDDLEHLP